MSKQECPYNSQADALIQRLTKRLYPLTPDDAAFSIDVRVAKDPAVNAYATLGGSITINTGFLQQAESAEEVAGVLAHEIGHVQHRHIMEGAIMHLLTAEGINMALGGHSSAGQWAKYFLSMDFTHAQEAQADKTGLQRLQQAHIDNQGFKHFFDRMEKAGSSAGFLSDHPSNRERVAMVETFQTHDTQALMTQDEWNILKSYCSGK